MAYIQINTNIDTDVYVTAEEYFGQCDESEKQDLRELVYEHFEIPFLDPTVSLVDAVIERLTDYTENNIEARDFIKRTLEEMEYKLKMRDFS